MGSATPGAKDDPSRAPQKAGRPRNLRQQAVWAARLHRGGASMPSRTVSSETRGGQDPAKGRCRPFRSCWSPHLPATGGPRPVWRRLQLLRKWSHHELDNEQFHLKFATVSSVWRWTINHLCRCHQQDDPLVLPRAGAAHALSRHLRVAARPRANERRLNSTFSMRSRSSP